MFEFEVGKNYTLRSFDNLIFRVEGESANFLKAGNDIKVSFEEARKDSPKQVDLLLS